MDKVDCVVIGAGVVGLAVAAELAGKGLEVVVLEQHDCIGSETSSRNSEVSHAGIYYPTGSVKARLCVRGKGLLYEYCENYKVPFTRCGKIIVAAHDGQRATVEQYIDKGHANDVHDLHWIDADQVAELEPAVRSVGAVMSPSTGIIDSHGFMVSLQGQLEAAGGMVALQTPVTRIEAGPVVHTPDFTLAADRVINSAGLQAPDLARGIDGAPDAHYAKGHYYSYSGRPPFSRLVYPVAEQGGLGVHVTLDLAGQVKFGPDVRWIDQVDYTFDNSHFEDFVTAIRNYFPGVEEARLQPSYTGIRPKIAPAEAGFTDFLILGPDDHGVAGCVHLLGIESPGLTSALAIAEEVAGALGR